MHAVLHPRPHENECFGIHADTLIKGMFWVQQRRWKTFLHTPRGGLSAPVLHALRSLPQVPGKSAHGHLRPLCRVQGLLIAWPGQLKFGEFLSRMRLRCSL